MASVALEHVEKVFANGVRAVDDLCLNVAHGEFVVLAGPSGCGKSTTLRMIAGLETASRGTIALDGRAVDTLSPKDRNVSMVFQTPALYPHMTVRQNMAFPLVLRKRPAADRQRKVCDVARLLGIESLLDRKPGQLSGGQQQRAALGRALVRDPACFLLDEPLAHLDGPLRLEMRDQIKRLHAQLGATMLYVTHDQEEAMTLGSRLALLRHGRIQQIGSPLDVFHRPANRFVAGFLGSPPMNFLEGTVLSQDGRLWFDDGSQRLAVPERAEPSLASRRGTRLLLGVRPEHLAMCPFAGQSGNCLTARVVAVEPLGSRADVFLATERQPRIVARLEWPVPLTPGAVAQMYVDLDRIHFFDADDDCGQPGASLCAEA